MMWTPVVFISPSSCHSRKCSGWTWRSESYKKTCVNAATAVGVSSAFQKCGLKPRTVVVRIRVASTRTGSGSASKRLRTPRAKPRRHVAVMALTTVATCASRLLTAVASSTQNWLAPQARGALTSVTRRRGGYGGSHVWHV